MNNNQNNNQFVDETIFFKVWRNIVIRRNITGIDRIIQIEMVTKRMEIIGEMFKVYGYNFKDEIISGGVCGRYIYYNSSIGNVSGQNWLIHDYIFGIKDSLDTTHLFKDFEDKIKFRVLELFKNNGLSKFTVNDFINDYINTFKIVETTDTTTATTTKSKNEIRKEILNKAIQYHLKKKNELIFELNKYGLKYLELTRPIEQYEFFFETNSTTGKCDISKRYMVSSELSIDDQREWKMYTCHTTKDIENLIKQEFEFIKINRGLQIFKELEKNKLYYNQDIFKKTETFKQFINDHHGEILSIQQVIENEKIKVNEIKQKIDDKLIENELGPINDSIYKELVQKCYSCNDLNDSLLSIDNLIDRVIQDTIKQRVIDLKTFLRDSHGIYGTSMNLAISRDYLNTYKQSERDLKFNLNEIIDAEKLQYHNKTQEFLSMIIDYNIVFDEKEYQNHLENFCNDNNNHHLYFNWKLDKIKLNRKDTLLIRLEESNLKYRHENQSFQTYINSTKISEQLKLPSLDQIIQDELNYFKTIKNLIITELNDAGLTKYSNKKQKIKSLVYAYTEEIDLYHQLIEYYKEKIKNKNII